MGFEPTTFAMATPLTDTRHGYHRQRATAIASQGLLATATSRAAGAAGA